MDGGEMAERRGWFGRLVDRVFGREIERRVQNAVRALEDPRDRRYGESERDLRSADRDQLLKECFEAWRFNGLGRRIVELMTDYVVGGGLGIRSEHEGTHEFLDRWWNHRLNAMPVRSFEWCDELTRAGELFIVVSTDASGMSYLRAVPAADVGEIETAPNDLEQEVAFHLRPMSPGDEGKIYAGYDETKDVPDLEGRFPTVMVHYAVNRPVGAQRGESDLVPLLKWLTRYSGWLEDRVRLNRFRQAFVYWVKGVFVNAAARLGRQAELNANPPKPGAVLVTDKDEEWDVLQPRLESHEAAEDGMAVKKFIGAGAGVPMHFLAEPESATRTTAEQAGGPTYRHYSRRQLFVTWMFCDLATIAVRRRARMDRTVRADSKIEVAGTDISVRDNASLAVAASSIVNAFAGIRDRGLIDDKEFLRLAYRFAGEIVDVDAILAAGRKAGPVASAPKQRRPSAPVSSVSEDGTVKIGREVVSG